jgi:hypothetical protein
MATEKQKQQRQLAMSLGRIGGLEVMIRRIIQEEKYLLAPSEQIILERAVKILHGVADMKRVALATNKLRNTK